MNPLDGGGHPKIVARFQERGHRPLRVFFLVVFASLILALGGLEAIASRSLRVSACPLPETPVATSDFWTSEYWQ